MQSTPVTSIDLNNIRDQLGIKPGDGTEDLDPFFGVEQIRRALGLSKPAFYSPGGIIHDLPVTQLSAKRKGVRKSALERVLAERTTPPRNAA